MRVLFSTTAGLGHFTPMVPLARACAAAGHDVAVAAPASFADQVSRAGLRHLPFPDVPAAQTGAVYARVVQVSREEANRLVVGEIFGRLDAQAALPVLTELTTRLHPDIVVRDPAELGSLVAAVGAGIPQVQVAIGMDQFVPMIAGWLDEPLRELEVMAGLSSIRGAELVLRTPTLTTVPAGLSSTSQGVGSEQPRPFIWRFRDPAIPAGPDLPPSWGDPNAPLLYTSFGSVAGSAERFRPLYRAVLQALAELPVRVLMTTGAALDEPDLGPLPPNACVLPWWPQNAAMTQAALVLGHGGFGTTMAALGAGVPQIVLPLFSSDQFLNAERIQAVGAGLQLIGDLDVVDQLPDAVTTVLYEPGFAARASAIAAEMAALPDVSSGVKVLQDLVR